MSDENEHDVIKDESTERCPKCNMLLLGYQQCMNCENRNRALQLLAKTLRILAESQDKQQLAEEE